MSELLRSIRAGDRVTIVDRFGERRTGRAVMLGPAGWVLNMGGRYGTPGIASEENIVRVSKSRARADARKTLAQETKERGLAGLRLYQPPPRAGKRVTSLRQLRKGDFWEPDLDVQALAHADPVRPMFSGQSVRIHSVGGAVAVLRKMPGGVDYSLRVGGARGGTRYGSLSALQPDIAHFRLYGKLPHDRPVRP